MSRVIPRVRTTPDTSEQLSGGVSSHVSGHVEPVAATYVVVEKPGVSCRSGRHLGHEPREITCHIFYTDCPLPDHGLNVGSAEDAQGKQEKRRLVELFQRSGGHDMHCMCSLERNFECTGGLWRPESEALALLASL